MSNRHELDNKLRGESRVRKGLMKSHAHIKPIRLMTGTSREVGPPIIIS